MKKLIVICSINQQFNGVVASNLMKGLGIMWPGTLRSVCVDNEASMTEAIKSSRERPDAVIIMPESENDCAWKAVFLARHENPSIPAIVWANGNFKRLTESSGGIFVLKYLPRVGPRLVVETAKALGIFPKIDESAQLLEGTRITCAAAAP